MASTGFHLQELGRGHTDSVTCLALSSRSLASGGDDGSIYLWSPDQFAYPAQSTPRMEPCSALSFNPDKFNLLYSAHGRRIVTWDVRRLTNPLCEWVVNEDEINSLDVLSNDEVICAADDTGAIQIINITNGKLLRTLKKHDNICSVACFRPNRTWQLISGGLDCRMIVSDWKGTGRGVIIFELDEIVESSLFSDYHFGDHSRGYVTQDSSDSHASSNEYTDVGNDERLETSENFDPSYLPQAQSEESHSNTGGRRGILLPEVESGWSHSDSESQSDNEGTTESAAQTWPIGFHVAPPMVHCIACSPSGDFVAAGLEKSTIELFAGSGKRLNYVESLYGHRRSVAALHFVNDSSLVSGGNDCGLFLWNIGTDIEGRQLTHDSKVNALKGNELRRIFVADSSSVIRVFDFSSV